MKAFTLSPCLALLLCLVPAASAQEEDPLGVIRADEMVDVRTLLSLAEGGDARASFLLGTRYASGRAGVQDDSEALRWFTKAAEKGLAEAQYNLGIMYAAGRGAAPNAERAAYWFEQAAKQGVAEAQFNLGTFYGMGVGVPQDEKLAADWLRRAAEKGLAEAEFNLGILYEHGRGVRLDGQAAMEWYDKAARKGYQLAEERLAALKEKMRTGGLSASDAAPAAAQSAAGAVPPVPRPAMRANEWVRSLDSSHFTLQLISHQREELSTAFLEQRQIGDQGGYFVSQRDGQTWFSVIYGVFPSLEDAEAAARALPASLSDLEPWVRNIGAIQAVLSP